MRTVRIALSMTGAAVLTGLIFFCFGRTGAVDNAAAGQIEIVLGEPDVTVANILSEGDSLRVALKFREAMAAYEALLDKGGLNEAAVKEALRHRLVPPVARRIRCGENGHECAGSRL